MIEKIMKILMEKNYKPHLSHEESKAIIIHFDSTPMRFMDNYKEGVNRRPFNQKQRSFRGITSVSKQIYITIDSETGTTEYKYYNSDFDNYREPISKKTLLEILEKLPIREEELDLEDDLFYKCLKCGKIIDPTITRHVVCESCLKDFKENPPLFEEPLAHYINFTEIKDNSEAMEYLKINGLYPKKRRCEIK